MFIECKTITVTPGNSQIMIDKFSGSGLLQEQKGFVEKTVLKRVRKGDTEEVVVMIKWESQQDFTNWKKSDAHKAGHSSNKKRADFIVDVKLDTYTVENTQTI